MSDAPETTNLTPPATETPAADPSLITGQTEQQTTTETSQETTEQTAETQVATPEPLTVEALSFPEGFTVSDELSKEFVDTLNNSELSPKDRAEALINLQAKAMTAAEEARSAAWTDLQDQWRNEVKAEYGDRLQPTLDSINKLVTEYGDSKLVDALAVTGAGNNLEVIKFFSKIAGVLTEGSFTRGQPAAQEKSAAQKLYPSMPN